MTSSTFFSIFSLSSASSLEATFSSRMVFLFVCGVCGVRWGGGQLVCACDRSHARGVHSSGACIHGVAAPPAPRPRPHLMLKA
jgi:hypothetical protein